MNSHLNVFKTYTNSSREYQLENDLTRAFAITLQEDSLFFNEVIKEIFNVKKFYTQLFDSLTNENKINIDIQKKARSITEFEHIFAIALSETKIGNFWNSECNQIYDPICDLVIQLNNIYLVIEVKRENIDCTDQLYNQVLNIICANDVNINSLNENEFGEKITPFDLNWVSLMSIATRVLSFENSYGNKNRFLNDFVDLVKNHNYKWLPQGSISSLNFNNKELIFQRIELAIIEASKINKEINKLPNNDRLSISFPKDWAKEILFSINDNGDLEIAIYPGNTKSQGEYLFKKNPSFINEVQILNEKYTVNQTYHIKFTSFQKYFTGLWFKETDLINNLYTSSNFMKYTGRKKRGNDWFELETLFDNNLNYDWRKDCNWINKIQKSGKSQFDISFGYELAISIPFNKLKSLDTEKLNINNLATIIIETYSIFKNNLLM